ncbi:MAG: hypothetical protein Q8P05_03035 [Candidatus Diapherotrites archaeon]|nr:hypothetical protein [Candidatus Diapherotrites archaeon]
MRRTWLYMGLAFFLLFAIAILFSLLQNDIFAFVDPEGGLKQTPVLYLALLAIVLVAALILRTTLPHHSGKDDLPFALRGFIAVALSGILVGGIGHEIVHLILLRHPTQFRVHFGDPTAILSTCCLLPGELPYEEIAYLIQFIITMAWIWYFRHLFITSHTHSHSPIITPTHTHSKTHTSLAKSNRRTAQPLSGDEAAEAEWRKERAALEVLLGTPSKPSHAPKKHVDDAQSALDDLKKLRLK